MPAIKPFLSYKFADQEFVERVYYLLSKQGASPFYWPVHGRAGELNKELRKPIDECDSMIAFLGSRWDGMQKLEVEYFLRHRNGRPLIPVRLVENLPNMPHPISDGRNVLDEVERNVVVPAVSLDYGEDFGREIASKILPLLGLTPVPEDGLPNCFIVDKEKEFLENFRNQDEALLSKMRSGCGWTLWPSVKKEKAELPNPIIDKSIGTLSDDAPRVLLDPRTNALTKEINELTLPEARPREYLRYPRREGGTLRVGILVSGGIAPGINAVIEGIVLRHELYSERQNKAGRKHCLEILGFREGFRALLDGGLPPQQLDAATIRRFVEVGGSYLGTSRADELLPGDTLTRDSALKYAVDQLGHHRIDILYVIGGDGSMSCAHALWEYAKRKDLNLPKDFNLSVVGIPKAMDNDILWVWQSFGFLSSVEEARQAILHIHTEVSSNPRVGIIQLFGSDSGFVASHAGYSTACDMVLIPEDPMTMNEIVVHIRRKLISRYNNGQYSAGPYAIVVMAETALPADAEEYVENELVGLSDEEKDALRGFLRNDRRVRGQTPDALRRAGLKIVSRVLQERIRNELKPTEYWEHFRVITNEPRHLIRSIPPSVTDVIFGERLGALAVDNAMAGYTDFMVSQWLTEFVLVPLPLVVLGRKRVPTNGIFWKSVLSKTGQRG